MIEISTVSAAAPRNTQSATQRKSSAAIIVTTPPPTPARFHQSHQVAIAVDRSASSVSQPAIRASRAVRWRHATNNSSTSAHPVSTSSGKSDSSRSR